MLAVLTPVALAAACERTEFQIVIQKLDKDFLRLHHWDLLPVLCSQSTSLCTASTIFTFSVLQYAGQDHILCAFLGAQDHNGALRRFLVIREPSAFGDVTRDLISKLRFAFAATAGQHRCRARDAGTKYT